MRVRGTVAISILIDFQGLPNLSDAEGFRISSNIDEWVLDS
jgi:hypothetical protein